MIIARVIYLSRERSSTAAPSNEISRQKKEKRSKRDDNREKSGSVTGISAARKPTFIYIYTHIQRGERGAQARTRATESDSGARSGGSRSFKLGGPLVFAAPEIRDRRRQGNKVKSRASSLCLCIYIEVGIG